MSAAIIARKSGETRQDHATRIVQAVNAGQPIAAHQVKAAKGVLRTTKTPA